MSEQDFFIPQVAAPLPVACLLFEGFPHAADALSVQIGLAPTHSCGPAARRSVDSYWKLLGPVAPGRGDVEQHLDGLVALLEPRAQEIARVADGCRASVVCAGYVGANTRAFGLTKRSVRGLARLNVHAEVELYE